MTSSYVLYNLQEELQKYAPTETEIKDNSLEKATDNSNNKHQVRDEYKKLLIDNIGLPELEAKDLEIGVFNATIDYATNAKIQLSWKCQLFMDVYINIARSIYSNLKKDSYIENKELLKRLESKEFLPHMLPYMMSEDIFPDRWKHIVDKNKRKFKAAYEVKQVAMTDQIQCSRCKSRKISYYELQTRSADESMTIFLSCLVCSKQWRM